MNAGLGADVGVGKFELSITLKFIATAVILDYDNARLFIRDNHPFRRSSPAFAGVTTRQEPSDLATLALVFECPKDTGPLPSQGRRLEIAPIDTLGQWRFTKKKAPKGLSLR